jgi:hypothetical protein
MGEVTVCHFTHKYAAGWKTNLPRQVGGCTLMTAAARRTPSS